MVTKEGYTCPYGGSGCVTDRNFQYDFVSGIEISYI